MLRLTIFTAGSRGDIQPCLVLGLGLKRAGFEVLVAAPQNFAGLISEYGLTFHPLRGDIQKILAGETGQKFVETGNSNPLQSILAMRTMLEPIIMPMMEDVLQACQQSDALITPAVFAPFGTTFAEICGIPLINVEPTPMLPTGEFPAPGWPIQKGLGRWANLISGYGMLNIIWQWYRPFVNEFRRRFHLRPLTGKDVYKALTTFPLLGAYSQFVIPRPRDWPSNVYITGYWFQDTSSIWKPSYELEAFLAKGEPPVYIGFGSMAGRNPKHFADIAAQALEKSGRRGILATGWGGLNVTEVPETIHVIESAPHDWLFPRMAAIVHHGGAGTTAEGMRAGVPAVIVPFVVDQHFWGKRVWENGAGPEPIPAKNLTATQLANKINTAIKDVEMKQKAVTIGNAIRTEDGVANAIQFLKTHLGV